MKRSLKAKIRDLVRDEIRSELVSGCGRATLRDELSAALIGATVRSMGVDLELGQTGARFETGKPLVHEEQRPDDLGQHPLIHIDDVRGRRVDVVGGSGDIDLAVQPLGERHAGTSSQIAARELPTPGDTATTLTGAPDTSSQDVGGSARGGEVRSPAPGLAPNEAAWRKAIADQVRRNCTPSSEAYALGGDHLICAVADWIEHPPDWSHFDREGLS